MSQDEKKENTHTHTHTTGISAVEERQQQGATKKLARYNANISVADSSEKNMASKMGFLCACVLVILPLLTAGKHPKMSSMIFYSSMK